MKKLILLSFFCTLFLGVSAQSTTWNTTGNSDLTESNFLGDKKCAPLIFKTKDMERMRLTKNHTRLGIGFSNPLSTLHLHHQNDADLCAYYGGNNDHINGDEDNTDGPTIRSLLRMTTPETGTASGRGFSAFYTDANLSFSQFEEGIFSINGPKGGLTIAPDGNIGMGTDIPRQKLHIVDGNILISKTSTRAPGGSPNGSIFFGANIDDDFPNGKWGIEYLNNDGGFGYGLNFWRPWNPGGGGYFNFGLFLADNGNIGIGKNDPQAKLDVNGDAKINGLLCAKEIRVSLSGTPCWPDYVFSKNYKLPTLSEVEQFITQNHYLPNVPPAAEVEANGVNLGEMNALLLHKIEELTLYIIQIGKRLSELESKKGGE